MRLWILLRETLNQTGLNSIQGRLTAIAFFFIICTALTMGVVGFRFTVNFENERFRDHFSLLASYLASNAELGVLLGNEKILEGLTESMLKVQDVQAVEIRDNDGAVIMHRALFGPMEELDTVSAPVVSLPMGTEEDPFLETAAVEEVLGQVTIAYSLSGLVELKQHLALRFVVTSLLLALAPVLMYWMLSRAISAPLLGLLTVAGQVSRGRMDVRASGGSLRETRTLARAINEMLDALQAKRRELHEANAAMARQQVLAEVGKFSMIVAHEIKNPLAIIKGSLGIVRKDTPVEPEIKKRMIGFIDEEIERINKLIEDFLIFSRPRTPALQVVSLDGLVNNLVQRIKLMNGDIQVVLDLLPAQWKAQLNCDVSLLERALLNIIRNALEVTAHGDQVRVNIACPDNVLVFTVLDEGPGIKPEDLPNIFEPFFSKKAKGTGLGLAIAQEVVLAHDGTLSATNRPEGGACFVLSLPSVRRKIIEVETALTKADASL